jgi:type IV secretion system protein VirB11
LPPVVAAPAFAIRKPAVAVFTLDDYVAAGIMASGQASALKVAVEARRFKLLDDERIQKTTRTAALQRPFTAVARQAAMDPDDGMAL